VQTIVPLCILAIVLVFGSVDPIAPPLIERPEPTINPFGSPYNEADVKFSVFPSPSTPGSIQRSTPSTPGSVLQESPYTPGGLEDQKYTPGGLQDSPSNKSPIISSILSSVASSEQGSPTTPASASTEIANTLKLAMLSRNRALAMSSDEDSSSDED
jgi:hypothetical protein